MRESDPVRRVGAAPSTLLVGQSPRSWLRRPRLHRLFWDLHSLAWDQRARLHQSPDGTPLGVESLARHAAPPARVLELGCATGTLACALGDRGFDVVGLDFSPAMVRKAQVKARFRRGGGLAFALADFNAPLPFRAGAFHHAIAAGILPSVIDPPRLFAEIARVLRPGGLLVVVAFGLEVTDRFDGTVGGLMFRLIRTVPGWRQRILLASPAQLTTSLGAAGLGVTEVRTDRAQTVLVARRGGAGAGAGSTG